MRGGGLKADATSMCRCWSSSWMIHRRHHEIFVDPTVNLRFVK
ncbi:MAG: DUF3678 domain-containing protein [Mesorhizobium sp.]|nr:MAG: DUF3678 domain-containing protein [Mesorhizobium sp.]